MLDIQYATNEKILATNYWMVWLKSSVPLYLGVQFGKKEQVPPRRTVVFTRSKRGVVELDTLTRAPHEPDYLAFTWKYYNSCSPESMGQIRYRLMGFGFNPVVVCKLFPTGSKLPRPDKEWIRAVQKQHASNYGDDQVIVIGKTKLHLGIGICPQDVKNKLVLLTNIESDMSPIDWLSFRKRAFPAKQFRWLWFGNDHDELHDFSRASIKKQLHKLGFDPTIVDSICPKKRGYRRRCKET